MAEPFAFTTGPDAFEGLAPDYSDRVALGCCEISKAAYGSADEFDRLLEKAGYHGGVIVSVGAAQIVVAYSPQAIIVAGAGSKTLGDYRDDLKSALWRSKWWPYLPKGRMAWGFRNQCRAVEVGIIDAVRNARDYFEGSEDAPIITTGHSLGGPLGAGATMVLHAQGRTPALAYPLESPRWANEKAAAWYMRTFCSPGDEICPTWRVVNTRRVMGGVVSDLVTRLPRRLLGFRHVGWPAILVDGEVLHGPDGEVQWAEIRRANPTRVRLRFVSREIAAILAHFSDPLLETLRARVA